MSITCEIDFENNPMKVIYARRSLCGTVKLHLNSKKDVRGVYIRIRGVAFCHWTEGTDDRDSHTGHEEYLDECTYFVGDGRSSGEFRLSPGTYNYSFQCTLPSDLPTSFEGSYGYIRYTAQVVLDIPRWLDKTFADTFTVIRAINLNVIPALREPVIVEVSKQFFHSCLLCCCSSNPLRIVARTPVAGYVPGQCIKVEINVKNDSNQPVAKLAVQLIKQITYHTFSSASQKSETISIIKQDTRGCDVNQEEIIYVDLIIPPIPPTDYSTNKVVKFRYSIRIIGSVAGCHISPVLDLPITIGTYPIQNVSPVQTGYPHPNTPTHAVISQQPSVTQFSDQNSFSSPPYEDPPTYEEALHAKNIVGGEIFKPRYPMFRHQIAYSNGN